MSEMTVGCIRTTVTPPLASGIYEAMLEKAQRENAELAERLSGVGTSPPHSKLPNWKTN